MKKKAITTLGIMLVLIIFATNIYAADFLQNVFTQASNFVNTSQLNVDKNSATNDTVGGALSIMINSSAINIVEVIFTIGNLVIFVVTIALGLKYIYSGIEGKADIKSSLPNYVFGVVFFYLADSVYMLSKNIMLGALDTGTSYNTFSGNIYSTVETIANTCAILGIVMVGLKYMLSPADAKADVKKQLIPVTIGIILVYCTLKVIMLVYNIGQGIIS